MLGCRLFPFMAPWNVMRLTLAQWLRFAAQIDAHKRAAEQQQQEV